MSDDIDHGYTALDDTPDLIDDDNNITSLIKRKNDMGATLEEEDVGDASPTKVSRYVDLFEDAKLSLAFIHPLTTLTLPSPIVYTLHETVIVSSRSLAVLAMGSI